MKAQVTTISTTSIRRFRRGAVGVAVLLVLAAAAVGLALALRAGVPSAPAVVPAINPGVSAPLDLYERHVPANAGVRVPLDLYERHLAPRAAIRAPLDAHERFVAALKQQQLWMGPAMGSKDETLVPLNPAAQSVMDYLRVHSTDRPSRPPTMPAPLDIHDRHPQPDGR